MAEATLAVEASRRLVELPRCLAENDGFLEVAAALADGQAGSLEGVWGSSCALVAAELTRHASGPLVVVCPHSNDVDELTGELALFSDAPVEQFPAWESEPGERIVYDETYGERLRMLKALAAGSFAGEMIVTSIQSLLQPVPSRATISSATRRLACGEAINVHGLLTWLVENGFHSTTAVELPGEFSSRGGILDLFAPDWLHPVRIELFDDQIESIRSFAISSQRSLASLEEVELTVLQPGPQDRDHLAAFLPEKSCFLLLDLAELETEGKFHLERLERPQDAHSVRDVLREIEQFGSVSAAPIAGGFLDAACHLPIESVERFSGDVNRLRDELDTVGTGQEVFIVCHNEAEAQRLAEVFAETALAREDRLHFVLGRLRSGFRLVQHNIVVVSGNELFQRTDLTRKDQRRLGRVIDSFLDLRRGDLVVHLAHGVGRYQGLKLLEKNDRAEEHLELEFFGGTKIYVPASRIELVQKYVGAAKSRAKLARIGGKSWVRQKQAVERAVTDLAGDMLELQATREARLGVALPADTQWQREFDAAFPYVETPDQLRAIAEIKTDMQRARPMDRLLCGDVGFGKTELAIRAAFKTVDAGYQVAILVPTTILAEQHHRTFSARMAEFPFVIAPLSRFCSAKEQRETIKKLAAGSIDIVIGTHRLASKDVKFHNLGLVIIDEEQRFGVAVKERLKSLRQTVDVMTMTATPIPRTLHFSLLGLRDISNLETAPADRLAVETRVTRFNYELIRHAVLREISRGGQIFFVHNRVHDIDALAQRLREIVPEATLEIAHGQMPEAKLEKVMLDFVDHKFDMLLATTIIESGLDIPNANTIFIDEADRYGLADLHQLRGRVGRYKHRAYCYLLLDPAKHVSPASTRRLRAIEEFSDMGAGFAIAMRDLEIRGAGNILGTEQSGHIATVGYELYCELLEQAVRRLKHMPPKASVDVNVDLPVEAYLPRTYLSDMRTKIDLYRRLARIASEKELADFAEELVDRFGAMPEVTRRLLELARLRIFATGWQIHSIHVEDGYLVFGFSDRSRIDELKAGSSQTLRIVDERTAYLPLGKAVTDGNVIYEAAKSLLQPA